MLGAFFINLKVRCFEMKQLRDLAIQLDRSFRNLLGPRIGGAVHSPSYCNSHGSLGRCRYCGASIYFWTCDHMNGQWLPFEAWANGQLESGAWDFHNEGFCILDYSELVRRRRLAP